VKNARIGEKSKFVFVMPGPSSLALRILRGLVCAAGIHSLFHTVSKAWMAGSSEAERRRPSDGYARHS